jgi:hypothetical protein
MDDPAASPAIRLNYLADELRAGRFRTALIQRHRHSWLAIEGSDLWVGVAGMREEILDVRNLEFRTRPDEAMDQSGR